jgi:glycosyltransferase involved in cell wall biosynthesis
MERYAMRYDSALRYYPLKRIEEIEKADLVVGIPCFNNERTIRHVIQMVTHGLHRYYRDLRSVLYIADGGSTDDTREVAKEFEIKPWQEKIVAIYRGPAGKGTAFRSIFEAVRHLRAKACAVVDSDLRSITSDWLRYLLEPVLEGGFEYVSPIYARHKYDGTITNNIVYNLTRALYGKRIRQPIGGEFAFDGELAHFFLEQDVWDTDVARYGIDIWMTTNAITQGRKICQARLGVKIHDAKDPSASLGPMFRQVIGTLFSLMERNVDHWKPVRGSVSVPTFGPESFPEPEPVEVNQPKLVSEFRIGLDHYGVLWKKVFCPECYEAIEGWARLEPERIIVPVEIWAKMLYELAVAFHRWKANRETLISMMVPLYFARVASFVNQTRDMDSRAAEELVEEQALVFEREKDYLVRLWEESEAPSGQERLEGAA